MIWRAVRRVFVTELHTRVMLGLLLAVAGTLGITFPEQGPAIGILFGIGLMAAIYRVRYGRW